MRSLLAIVNVLGALLALFACYYLLPIVTALDLRRDGRAVGVPALRRQPRSAAGALLLLATRRYRAELKPRDGYLLVSLSWIAVAADAAVPLMLAAPRLSFTDAFFESMSGLSTTGSTVITGLDQLPHAVNLWRCALHWLGGMGIIVLAVAVLPLLGVGGMQMYRAEAPGPVKDAKLTPRITETAKALWFSYAGITVAVHPGAVGRRHDAVRCHLPRLLGDVARRLLHARRQHRLVQFAADRVRDDRCSCCWRRSTSARISWRCARVTFSAYRRDPEARWVFVWLGASLAAVTLVRVAGRHRTRTLLTTFRHTAFNVVALATTSGFVTEDYALWPIFAPMWMLFLTCVIPSTGSTGGGIKMFRALIMIKQAFREMFVLVHPAAVAPLKIAGQVVPNRVIYSVLAFVFVYFMTVLLLTFTLLATGMDFISAFTAIIASVNNAGPGLGSGGPGHQLRVAHRLPDLGLRAGHAARPHRDLHLPGPVHAQLLAQVAAAALSRGCSCCRSSMVWRCSSITDFTRSPIETTPITVDPRTTGRWRMRCSVISRMAVVAPCHPVRWSRTCAVMMSRTGVSGGRAALQHDLARVVALGNDAGQPVAAPCTSSAPTCFSAIMRMASSTGGVGRHRVDVASLLSRAVATGMS